MTEIKEGDMVKLPGDDGYREVTILKETYLELPEPIVLPEETDSAIVFSTEDVWVMRISEKGIEFNREERPNWTVNDFARAVCCVLEKNFNVTFTEMNTIDGQ